LVKQFVEFLITASMKVLLLYIPVTILKIFSPKNEGKLGEFNLNQIGTDY
jgi:hypothetical protein